MPLQGLCVELTGACNLRCSYCYRGFENTRPMAKGARDMCLALLARSTTPEIELLFSGGEPLLEFESLNEMAGKALANAHADQKISLSLVTNGTLVTGRVAVFLAEHDFAMSISLDGVAEANDLRMPGSFPRVARALRELHRRHRDYFRRKVRVGISLQGSAVPHLAASVAWLIDLGVASIGISPLITFDASWSSAAADQLRAQLQQIVDLSVRAYESSGLVCMELLRKTNSPPAEGEREQARCNACSLAAITVDSLGRIWPCPLLAGTTPEHAPLAKELIQDLALHHVGHAALADTLERARDRARQHRLLYPQGGRVSRLGRCADCEAAPHCRVCPAAIANIPDNRDPLRIPDQICDFNRATISARQEFETRTLGARVWRLLSLGPDPASRIRTSPSPTMSETPQN